MAVYRELFYNNIEGFLSGGFPVLRRLYTDADWHRLVRDFYAVHRCKTPLFLEISQEFLDYLAHERKPRSEDPPFMLELAHYEWIELALGIAEEQSELTGVDPNGDLMSAPPVLSSLAWPLAYAYPVHRIGPDFRPEAPPEHPTHLLVYRDRTDEVRFMELNTVTARLLQLLEEDEPQSGRALLERIAEEMAHPNPSVVIEGGAQTLEALRGHGIILGARA